MCAILISAMGCNCDAGDLKKLLVHETSLQPNEQRLLFRGKQKDDSEWLHVAGVKDKAKIILVEDPASRERRVEAMRKQEEVAKACKAVGAVRSEVDKLAEKVCQIQWDLIKSRHSLPLFHVLGTMS